MASKKEKLEKLENAVVDLGVKKTKKAYEKFLDDAINEVGDYVEEGLKYNRKKILRHLIYDKLIT